MPARASQRKESDAEGDEALAVRVLVECVKKITDADLPIADKATDGALGEVFPHSPTLSVGALNLAEKPGEDILSLRVDHARMTDLSLGGILRPVVLIEKPKP